MKRKFLPTLADLLDRLSIVALKEMFIPEHRHHYAEETKDILHDIDVILEEEGVVIDADMIRAIMLLGQFNLHIWSNEASFRAGDRSDCTKLVKTHSINGLRNLAKNIIQAKVGHGRLDYKIDCIANEYSNFIPSGWHE